MARRSKPDATSSIYCIIDDSYADDLSDRQLNNETINISDDLFKTGEYIKDADGVVCQLLHNDTPHDRDRARTIHSEPTTANPRAEHETFSQKDGRNAGLHAEDFRSQPEPRLR